MKTETVENKGVSEIKKICAQYGIAPMELSGYLQVTFARIYEIFAGKRRITPDTDLRLCQFFKLEPGHFAVKQLEYDLQITQRELSEQLQAIAPVDKTVRSKK